MSRRKFLIATAAAATALLAPLAASAEIKERTMRFAFQNVADHPQGKGAAKVAEILAAKSGNKISVKLFPAGQLGGDLQTVSALQGGTLDLTVLNSGLLVGLDKRFAVLDFPFLFDTPEGADFIVDGAIGQKLHASLADKGLVGLGYWELGFRNVTNSKRAITKLEDFQGLKIRVLQSPLFIELFNTLGAAATPMAWPEVYSALEQRVVEGQENPYTTILGAKFQEVQKYVSETRHIYNAQSVLVSKKTWDSLTAEEQGLIKAAVTEAGAFQRQLSRDSMGSALDGLKKGGMQHNALAPAEIARIRDKIKPVVEKFGKEVGPELVAEINAELAKKRGK